MSTHMSGIRFGLRRRLLFAPFIAYMGPGGRRR